MLGNLIIWAIINKLNCMVLKHKKKIKKNKKREEEEIIEF